MSEQAALGSATVQKVLKDGTIRLVVDIEPRFRDVLASWLVPDMPVAVARITQHAAAKEQQSALGGAGNFGDQARELRLSGFFRAPDVWRAIGTDAEYQAWCRGQPCASCGKEGGEGNPIVYAHVRRVADGAGVGIKPPFSGVPLHDSEHRDQHQHGESRIAPPDTWDRWRIEHVQAWGWARLKEILGVESWRDAHPRRLYEWAERAGVERYLPAAYRELAWAA